MKITHKFRRALLQVVCILFLVFPAFSTAQADVIEDVAWVLDQTSPNPFGISGSTLLSARDFFTCIDGGEDPVICYDTYFAPILESQGIIGIPSWFSNFVDGYVAIVTEDYWGLIVSWGETAFCAACNGLTGVDVCNLIGLYIQLYEEAYDLAASILSFFGIDVGEVVAWVWDTLEDAWCGIFGCDEEAPPPPPAEAVAYANYFHPNIVNGTGLFKLKLSDSSFDKDFDSISKKAIGAGLPASAVETAGKDYKTAIDQQWTGDMMQNVLPALASSRNRYNSDQQIAADAQASWNKWLKSYHDYGLYPAELKADLFLCEDYFRTTSGYEHVDRWINRHPGEAQSMGIMSNSKWCHDAYIVPNKDKFNALFLNFMVTYMGSDKCPASGDKLVCTSSDNYATCRLFLNYLGKQEMCSTNPSVARAAVDAVDAYFKSNGSTIPCNITYPTVPGKAADFTCKRPIQRDKCNQYLSGTNSSIKLVNCLLNEDPGYVTLKQQVVNAVNQINAKFASTAVAIQGDPLQVRRNKGQFSFVGRGGTLEQNKENIAQMEERQAAGEAEIAKNWQFQRPPSESSYFVIINGQLGSIPFDGLSTPTIEVVEGGLTFGGKEEENNKWPALEGVKDRSGLKTQLKGQTAGSKLQNQLESGKFVPNPVNKNSGGSSDLAGIGGLGPGLGGVAGAGSKGTGFGTGPGKLGNGSGPGFSGVGEGFGQGTAERLKEKVGSFTSGGNTSVTMPGSGGVGSEGSVTSPVATGSMLSGLSKVGSLNKATGPAYAAGSGPNAQSSVNKKASVSSLAAATAASNQYGNQNAPGQSQQQQQVMSGSVPGGAPQQPAMTQALQSAATQKPGGMALKTNGGAPPATTAPAPMSPMSGSVPPKPDITAATQVSIAGKQSPWNGLITVDDRQAASKSNGLCSVTIQYSVANKGTAPSGMFKSAWTNSAVPGNWGKNFQAIAPGASLAQSDTITLKPGPNMLTLSVDSANQVQETNEANNTSRVTVTVTGTCGAAGVTSPAASPGSPAGSRMPSTLPKPGGAPQLGR